MIPPGASGTGASPGTDLHLESHGAGATLVLAHGFAGSARNFRPQIRALRDRFRVVVYDARGHARSPAPDDASAYRLPALAADLGAVLDAVGATRAVVGGLSLGAAVALAYALGRPDRVRGLVLASFPAGAGRGAVRDPVAFADALEHDAEAAGERFVWGPASGLDPASARLVRQGFREHPPRALAHVLRETLAVLPGVDALAPRLRSLRIPVLVVAGTADPAGLASGRALAAVLPRAHLAEVAAGHVVNLGAPGEFNSLVKEFLEELPVAPSSGASG